MTIAGIIEQDIIMPEGVTVQACGATFTVTGPKGSLSRDFTHPRVEVKVHDGGVRISCEYPRVKEKALIGTFRAHLNNMVKGVTEGFEYHMRMVYSHFPMKVSIKGDMVVIDNYMGGRAPREADIVGDTKVMIKGAEITVSSINIESAGQTAANIEKACSRRGFDKRVFQDGIYIIEKPGRVIQ